MTPPFCQAELPRHAAPVCFQHRRPRLAAAHARKVPTEPMCARPSITIRGTEGDGDQFAPSVLGLESPSTARVGLPAVSGGGITPFIFGSLKTRGRDRTRTCNNLLAKQAIYQLNYTPRSSTTTLVPRGKTTRAWRLSCSLLATSYRPNRRSRLTRSASQSSYSRHSTCASVPVGIHWSRHMLLTSSGWRSRCRPSGPHAQHVMSSSRRAIGPYSVLP